MFSGKSREDFGERRWPYGEAGIHFSHEDDEPHVFSDFGVDHSLRHAAPTLAALTLMSAPSSNIAPSDSLSAHSRALSQKGIAMGLIQPNRYNPETRQTNTIAREGRDSYRYSMPTDELKRMLQRTDPSTKAWHDWTDWEQVPHEQVGQARTMVRQLMATNRGAVQQSRLQRRAESRGPRLSDERLAQVMHEGNIFG